MRSHKNIQILNRPKLTVPESEPLSPCFIKPYKIEKNGDVVENKGYIPVSLLVNAIKNRRMLNIAVAGNYGVGKSSIIKTAEKRLRWRWRYNFIKISLASLLVSEHKALKDNNSPTIEGNIPNEEIEYSILQQILYHDRPQKTPKSKIRRIHKTSCLKLIGVALLIIAVLASLILLVEPEWFIVGKYISKPLYTEWSSIINWGSIITIGLGILVACISIGRRFSFTVTRVGHRNVEVKVGEEPSVFNIHMDEIVYFFESTRYDVVVFEDLDRFQCKEVLFYKLRELNTILNNSRCLKRRKISFVYAVRDDLFGAIDRVKFFDYIVSVIPVVNSLNSYDKLKECIDDEVLFNKLGEKELYKLCDYLQDMRLLLNIVNEFNQYAPLMNHKVMTEKVLFGLVVYKNYVPSDFSLMYNKGGVVSAAIENADQHRLDIIAEKKKEIDQHKVELDSLKDQLTNQIFQLRKKFLDRGKVISGYPSNNGILIIEDGQYTFDDVALDQKLFDQFRKGNALLYINTLGSINFPSFEILEKGLKINYDDEITKIKSENESSINEVKKQIEEINAELGALPDTVQGIYEIDPDSLDDELSMLKDNDSIQIVKYLFLNGYLDRHYQYYISYFYPNSLSYDDRIFVMRAGRHEGIQYDVKLSNITEVLKRFEAKDFAVNNALLNVDLVREIFGKAKYKSYRDQVCQGIKKTKNLDFILLSYHNEEPIKDDFFFQLLTTYDYWDEISDRNKQERDDLREIYIRYCDINSEKPKNRLRDWISNNYSFINKRWEVISTDRIIKVLFKECTPRFKKLNLRTTPIDIWNDIYEKGLYEFNEYNVKEIANRQGVLTDYSISSYATICKLKNESLLKMVKSNWTTALREVFPETSVYEDEETQVAMMNDLTIPEIDLRYYLSKQMNRIKHANKLNDIRLSFAFDNSLVEASWNNVYYYSITMGKGLPLAFMEKNSFKSPVVLSLTMEEEQALSNLVVFSDEISIPKYKELVPLFGVPFSSIPNAITKSRIKYLVDNNYLVFNEANFDTLKQYSYTGAFLVNNVAEFIRAPEKFAIDNLDAVAVLKGAISKSAKCEFIRAIRDKDLAPSIDLSSLIRPFLISGEVSVRDVSSRLLVNIVTKAQGNDKVVLGRKAVLSSYLDEEETKAVLSAMGGDYKKLVSRSSKTSSISYSTNNMKIVNHLVRIGLLKGVTRAGNSIVVEKMV